MNKILSTTTGAVVLNEFGDGVNVVQGGTPLKFVNYFDGMLMRAETMKLEQQGMFNLSQLSNQAVGHGVVWGFDSVLGNDGLEVGSGMAINSDGRIVYLPNGIELSVDELINKSSEAGSRLAERGSDAFADCEVQEPGDSVTVIEGTQYYVITVDNLRALCGEDDVYGRLCEEACITATDRPYQLNGVVIRAEALPADLILPQSNAVSLSGTHLRSRIASAFYEYERNSIASHISGEGLGQRIWCNGARLPGGFTRGVPIALLARQGNENLFLDRWIVTRERMESPPRNYWAHIMAMRPWNQFLAQVLQFQCQINSLFGEDGIPVNPDPCADTKTEIKNLSAELERILSRYQVKPIENENESAELTPRLIETLRIKESETLITQVAAIQAQLSQSAEPSAISQNRILISGGIVETPSAGYLPVDVDSQVSVNEQVEKLMGEGVDLRFCAVRPDFIPHALEEAQHMERISLLQGLDNSGNKPKVDVLVPNGFFGEFEQSIEGTGYEMKLALYSSVGRVVDTLVPKELNSPVTEIEAGAPVVDEVAGAQIVDEVTRALRLRNRERLELAQANRPGMVAIDQNRPLGLLNGVGRGAVTDDGGFSFAFAGIGQVTDVSDKTKRDQQVGVSAINHLSIKTQVDDIALWADMSIAKDPISMQIGESTTTNAEIDMVANVEGETRLRFNANLNVKVIDEISSGVSVQLTGEVRTRLNGASTRENSITVNRTATVRRGDLGERSVVLASTIFNEIASGQNIALSAIRERQNATEAQFRLVLSAPVDLKSSADFEKVGRITQQSSQLDIAEAKQRASSEVFNPSHPLYEAAYKGLNLISDFARQPDLTDIRGNRLFRNATDLQQSNQLYAKNDWVFFHRRRDKVCSVGENPTQVIDRPYRVFTVEVESERVAKELLQEIAESNFDVFKKYPLQEVTDVNFLANSSSIKTSRQKILSDWNLKVNDNVKIHSGVIANHPEWSEPASLATARVGQLNQVVDDETQISEGADFLVLNNLPPVLSQLGQGGIIYITEPVSTTCHLVLRTPRTDSVDSVISGFRERLESAQSIEELLKVMEVQAVGNIRFIGQGNDLFDQQEFLALQSEWKQLDNGPISAVIALSQAAQTENTVQAQSNYLADKLGVSPSGFFEEKASTSLSFPDNCWGITFMVPGYVSQNSVMRFNGVVPASMLLSMEEALATRGSSELIDSNWVAGGTVRFNAESKVIDETELTRVTESITRDISLPENVEWRVISVHPQGTSATASNSLEKETTSIAEKVAESLMVSRVTDARDELGEGVDGLTLMVPVDTSKRHSVLPVSISGSSGPEVVFHFDEDDELIKDEHFDEQIKRLKVNGVTAAAAEMVGKSKPRSNDKRLSEVFAVLKENEILSSGAAKKTTKLKESQLKALDVGSFRLPELLVLQRKPNN